MARLKDISDRLGLSVATVSRALNGYPEVNAETRKKVRAAAEEMGYTPNRLAQRLVTGRSGLVGFIAKVDPQFQADTTFYELLTRLTSELALRDVDLVLAVDPGQDPVAPFARMVGRDLIDGFILNAPVAHDPRIEYLTENGIPFVVHGQDQDAPPYPFFGIDNASVGYHAAEHLLSLGHRRILFLNGASDLAYAHDRAQGVEKAFADAKVDDTGLDTRSMTDLNSYGYLETLEAFGQDRAHPTAILCHSTRTAASALRALQDLALSVPRDVSLIAHDDGLPEFRSEDFDPPLTVTKSDLRDACAPLAEALLAQIAAPARVPLQTLGAAPLIMRGSTAPPRSADKR